MTQPEFHSLRENQVLLSRFRIVRLLGRGGMGEVYEAEDLELKEHLALKTIRPESALSPQMLARFKQELMLARRIRSRHVCRVNELYILPPDSQLPAFLTMELLDGPTLWSVLKDRGPLALDEVRGIAWQLCDALDAAHAEGIVHRDFKSSNVILTSGRAVVTDFGLARNFAVGSEDQTASAITLAGAVLGTPAYMAPEQFEGHAVTPATDIYALGVVLYEMLTGKPPFAGQTPMAAAISRGKQLPSVTSVRPGLDRRWDRTIHRCLEYDPSARFPSAGQVAAALKNGAVPNAVRRTWLAAMVLIPLVVLAALLWIRWQPGYHRPPPEVQRWYNQGVDALREGTYLKATRALEHALEMDPGFSLARARLADGWNELDFAAKAKDEMLRASAPNTSLPQVDRDYVEAVRATLTRDFPHAGELYQRILNQLPTNEKAYGYVDLGRSYEKGGKIEEAINSYTQSAQMAPQYPASFIHLGILQSRRKSSKEAEAAFAKAEALYRASSNEEGLAEIAYQRGYAANTNGVLDKAQQDLEEALARARAINSVQIEIRALLQLATVQYMSGKIEQSIQLSTQAIELARTNGVEYWAIDGLVRLGTAFMIRGELDKAEPFFQDALSLGKSNDRPRLIAAANLSLASLRNMQGRSSEAAPYIRAALDFYRQAGFQRESINSLLILARSEISETKLPAALHDSTEALAIATRAQIPVESMQAEETMGMYYLAAEEYPAALPHFKVALKLATSSNQQIDYQQLHLAQTYLELGRFSDADAISAGFDKWARQNSNFAESTALYQTSSMVYRLQWRQVISTVDAALSLRQISSDSAAFLLLQKALAESRTGQRERGLQRGIDACKSPVVAAGVRSEADCNRGLAALYLALSRANEAQLDAQRALQFSISNGLKDSQWRCLWLLARATRGRAAAEYARKSLDILNDFEHNWTAPDFETYIDRPDVREGRVELLKLLNIWNQQK